MRCKLEQGKNRCFFLKKKKIVHHYRRATRIARCRARSAARSAHFLHPPGLRADCAARRARWRASAMRATLPTVALADFFVSDILILHKEALEQRRVRLRSAVCHDRTTEKIYFVR